MTSEELQQLIVAGETLDVEFRGEAGGPCSDTELLEAVVALANRPGDAPGCLLVGVEDDGRVTGMRPRHGDTTDCTRLVAYLANRTRPSHRCQAEIVTHADSGLPVLRITIPAARPPIGTADGRYLRRALTARGRPADQPYLFHEMQAQQVNRAILDYSALTLPEATWDDLDALEFERFRRCIRENLGRGEEALLTLADRDLARAIGAAEPAAHGGATLRVLALLLFGSEEGLRRLLPTHEVAFQVLAGTEVRANDFYRRPLLRVMDEGMQRFRAQYREDELLVGAQRVGVPNLSEKAFREGMANALVHRDYARLGAIHVQWHGDKVRISSPGGFPEGVQLSNLLVTAPKPRNPLLAEAFKRAGLVERTSRGIDTIFEQVLRAGRPAPSYDCTTAVDVVLDIPEGRADLDFARFVVLENRAGHPLGLPELMLLDRLRAQARLGAEEAAELTQLPLAESAATLARLEEFGLAVGKGDGLKTLYHLTPAAAGRMRLEPPVLAADEPGAEDKSRLILDYVRQNGQIKREEVAELCTVSPRQASYLLDKLVLAGELRREGERRGVCYKLSISN